MSISVKLIDGVTVNPVAGSSSASLKIATHPQVTHLYLHNSQAAYLHLQAYAHILHILSSVISWLLQLIMASSK